MAGTSSQIALPVDHRPSMYHPLIRLKLKIFKIKQIICAQIPVIILAGFAFVNSDTNFF